MTYLKSLLAFIVTIAILLGGFLLYMPLHDGPLEIFAGGPFRSGDVVSGPEPDWSFLTDVNTVQIQGVEPPRSRTVWITVVDNQLYIPTSFMKTKVGKLWKRWPHHALHDSRLLMRHGDDIYERSFELVETDHEQVPLVIAELNRKYNNGLSLENVTSGDTWIFRLAEPASDQ